MTEQSVVQEELDSSYNLVKVGSLDVMNNWPVIRQTILLSFPPGVPKKEESIANLQEALLADRAQLWALRQGKRIMGFATTVVMKDTIMGCTSMFVYSMGSIRETPLAGWMEGLEALRRVAKRVGCSHILSRSNNPKVVEMLERLGAKTDVRMIELEV